MKRGGQMRIHLRLTLKLKMRGILTTIAPMMRPWQSKSSRRMMPKSKLYLFPKGPRERNRFANKSIPNETTRRLKEKQVRNLPGKFDYQFSLSTDH
jgi:hypothetical protein